jgi:DNA-directed RNA polymerase II subunit RPB3
MDISITNIVDENGELKFTLENANVSLANAIRRVILANIPIIVFRTTPYEKNDAEFLINTTRFNNEILKQRLSCIPIHIDDMDTPIEDYLLEVDMKNDTDNIIFVTTADFKIKNIKTDKYLNDNVLKNIFPPDQITGEYIDFARLRPKISETIDGEHLKFNCKFSKGIAKENNSFNCVST